MSVICDRLELQRLPAAARTDAVQVHEVKLGRAIP